MPSRGKRLLPFHHVLALLAWSFVMAALPVASPAGGRETFADPEDGRLDFSTYLLEHKGALPVPIAITEPAIGYGGGVALLFFQQSLADRITQRAGPTRYRPPDIYAAAGFGTENGTWGTGAGGLLSFADDRWRWRGGAGYVSANLDFYGVGSGSGSIAAGYNLAGLG